VGWHEWIRTVEIEPAIDASDAARLEREIEALLRTGCRIFHMEGASVDPVEAVGLLAPLVHHYGGVLDVHAPTGAFTSLAWAGADSVTFDANAVADPAAAVEEARAAGVLVGIAFDETVAVDDATSAAAGVDLVVCSCAGDGIVEHVRRLAAALPEGTVLQAEGAVTHENLRSLYEAGAQLLVIDEPIFSREDLPRAYRRLLKALA